MASDPFTETKLLSSPDAEAAAVRRLLDQGRTFQAHDLAQEAVLRFPNSLLLQKALALALLRAGAVAEARLVLEALGPQPDHETQGLIARACKETWQRSGVLRDAACARDAYRQAYQQGGGAWPGINAATLSWIVGDRAEAARLAEEALDDAPEEETEDVGEGYWRLATRGEALLLLGRNEEASAAYQQAVAPAGNRYAQVAASRRQLEMLTRHGLPVPEGILQTLRPPTLLVFAGHMIDRSDRLIPRFPAACVSEVKREIARRLDETDARIGYCSAACGSDLLFIEAMHERGAEVNVVLPYAQTDFLRSSVAFAGREWTLRFEEALAQAASVRYVTEESLQGDETVFEIMDRILLGYAALAGGLIGAEPVLLTVWDGRTDNPLPGGTADTIARWPDPARLIVIPLIVSAPEVPAPLRPTVLIAAPPSLTGPAMRRLSKTLLFADVVGYSRMQEEAMPAFMFHFLARVAGHLPRTPGFVNTWGDAIIALMDGATPLAEYALALQEVVCDTDWAEFGLPGRISVRIGLHAGPVFEGTDPITGALNYYGTHVNRAARLETVTVPGNVYASEQFAALLTAEQRMERPGLRPNFVCDYVGILALPKDQGRQPTYHVRRA